MSSSGRPRHSGCSWVWWNSPGTTPAPSRHVPWCSTVSSPASSRRKWLLPTPLPPRTATRSPNQSSRSNGSVSPSSSSCLDDRRPACRCGRRRGASSIRCSRTSDGPLVLLVELPQPALGRLQLRGEGVGHLGPPAHLGDQLLEPLALVVVPRAVPARACRGGPGGPRRSRRSRRRGSTRRSASTVTIVVAVAASSSRSWLTYRTVLRVAASSRFQPPLGRDVEEVVGLVEQQHVVLAAQQHLERQALLLAARERRAAADRRRRSVRSPTARVMHSSQCTSAVVAAVVAPVGERGGVAHRVGVGVPLGRGQPQRRRPAPAARGQRDEEIAHRPVRCSPGSSAAADELAHHAQPTVDRERARRRR